VLDVPEGWTPGRVGVGFGLCYGRTLVQYSVTSAFVPVRLSSGIIFPLPSTQAATPPLMGLPTGILCPTFEAALLTNSNTSSAARAETEAVGV